MAKYSGNIGFAITEESAPGVWIEQIAERHYYGDVTRNRTQIQTNTNVNGNITFSNVISILADPFAHEHFYSMRYITYLGKKWSINSIEVEYPRLSITIGGLYNG